MAEINDGGPAFPVPMVPWQDGFINVECAGMSVRIWLAGQIAAGLTSRPDPRRYNKDACGLTLEHWRDQCCDDDAEYCLRKADAIIKAAGL